jgi:hypothetical protein
MPSYALRMNMHACYDETYKISYLQPTADGEINVHHTRIDTIVIFYGLL